MTKKISLSDYLLTNIENSPLLKRTDLAGIPVFISDINFQGDLVEYMLNFHSDWYLRKLFSKDTGVIPRACNNLYRTNAYKYQHLYDTTMFVYDPIENYNMKEKGTDTNSGTDTTTVHRDPRTVIENLGQQSDTMIYGAQKSTSVSNSINKVSPYETSDYRNKDMNDTTGSTEQNAYTDDIIREARTNTTEYNEEKEVSDLEHGHILEHELTRSGNIGVTTTQAMIMQERNVAMFNITELIARDIVHLLTIGVV